MFSSAGVHFLDDLSLQQQTSSTDAGDVSHALPTIHPTFGLSTTANLHTVEFQKASGTPNAFGRALVAGKSLALTCLEVMGNRHVLHDIKREFLAAKGSVQSQRELVAPPGANK